NYSKPVGQAVGLQLFPPNEKPGTKAGAFSIEPRHFNRKPSIVPDARGQMASSDFWRERANEFQSVPDRGMLRADGQYTVGSGAAWSWRLAGGANEYIRSTFETIARRSASELTGSDMTDLLVAWLEAIRKEQINFQSPQIMTEEQED